MQYHHHHFPAGHPGAGETFRVIQKKYYWPHMCDEIRQVVALCQQCAIAKSSRIGEKPAPIRRESIEPWDTAGIDQMGHDSISQQMLKLASLILSPTITVICNCSFATSISPAYWKKALINPLLKTPTPYAISDTRTIAILPEQSKILERKAFDQLSYFLEQNNLLNPSLSNKLVIAEANPLAAFTEDIRFSIEQSKIIILILLDFSKAFDSIPHKRLLQKLRTFYLLNPSI